MSSSSCVRRLIGVAFLVAVAIVGGCSSPTPTAPTAPANVNLAGRWSSASGSYQWILTQTGTTVTGIGSGTNSNPVGTPISGTLTGSVAGGNFTFSEERSWTVNGVTQVQQLHSDEMHVTSGSMTGVVSYLPLFPPYRPSYSPLTMVRVVVGS